jgi:hypothetical protein
MPLRLSNCVMAPPLPLVPKRLAVLLLLAVVPAPAPTHLSQVVPRADLPHQGWALAVPGVCLRLADRVVCRWALAPRGGEALLVLLVLRARLVDTHAHRAATALQAPVVQGDRCRAHPTRLALVVHHHPVGMAVCRPRDMDAADRLVQEACHPWRAHRVRAGYLCRSVSARPHLEVCRCLSNNRNRRCRAGRVHPLPRSLEDGSSSSIALRDSGGR